MNTDIYAHFHPDERHFVDKAADWIVQCAHGHEVKRTNFLDPRQAYILETLVHHYGDVKLRFCGGYDEAERRRAIIGPDYRDLDSLEMGIQVVSVTSNDTKILSLEHGDYLGAILGLGIKREKIGDLQVRKDGCHFLAASEIIEFIHLHLHQVHRVHVLTEILAAEKLILSSSAVEELNFTVASLRLDGIVGDVCRLSRARALEPIKAGRCRVNWKAEEDPSKLLKAGDVISVQGFGRFKLLEIKGVTKKGRIRVKIGRFI